MVTGQRLGHTAGHCDDIQRDSGSDPVTWGDNHRRAELGNPVRVRHFRPDNATELEWPRHTSLLWALKTAWARPLQTTVGEEERLWPSAPNRPEPRAARPPAAPATPGGVPGVPLRSRRPHQPLRAGQSPGAAWRQPGSAGPNSPGPAVAHRRD